MVLGLTKLKAKNSRSQNPNVLESHPKLKQSWEIALVSSQFEKYIQGKIHHKIS